MQTVSRFDIQPPLSDCLIFQNLEDEAKKFAGELQTVLKDPEYQNIFSAALQTGLNTVHTIAIDRSFDFILVLNSTPQTYFIRQSLDDGCAVVWQKDQIEGLFHKISQSGQAFSTNNFTERVREGILELGQLVDLLKHAEI